MRSRGRIATRRPTAAIGALHTQGKPEAVERAVDELARAVERAAGSPLAQAGVPVDVDLVVGTNRVAHGLGRRVQFVFVVPKYADAAFAWAFDPDQPDNPTPERQVQIDVIGTDMPCRLVFA